MKVKISVIAVLTLGLVISGCGQEQVPETALAPKPTATPSSTSTPIPTQISTPIPVSLAYKPVPRWMILSQPFYDVEILGEIWNYTNDRWGDAYACISYSREQGTPIWFEQCFALIYSEEVSFESQRDQFLTTGYEELTPQNTFGDTGQIALLGKRLSDNTNKVIEFFEIIGIGDYVTLVELDIEMDDDSSLQSIYEEQVAGIMDYVLQDSLQKAHLIPRPTATPLSPTQEKYHTTLAQNLISEIEASTLYAGTWEALGDFVDSDDALVCRDFEDRTNADVLWVYFSNCVEALPLNFDLDKFVDNFMEPGDVILESRHQYDDKLILYAYQDGHTFFNAWMIHEEYLYFVRLESRTLAGQKVEDVFTDNVDDFIYSVLMTNADK